MRNRPCRERPYPPRLDIIIRCATRRPCFVRLELCKISPQASISRRRFSNRSPRRYAASTWYRPLRQRHLDHFAREARALGCPIAEARPEPVRGQIAPSHPSQKHQESHVAERPASLAAGKDELRFLAVCGFQFFQDGDRARRQGHAMLAAGFHACGRYNPKSFASVDLIPPRADALPGPRGRQDREFERARSNTLLLAQAHHEGWQLGVGQGGMVFDLPHLRARR